MAVSSASTASTSASRRAPTRFRRSSRRSVATTAGRDASSAPDTHCSSRRTGSGVAMFRCTQRLLTDCGGAKPNLRQVPKRPHAGPGGRAGVGAGSPSVRCWGGINTSPTVRATRSRSDNVRRQRGVWGRRRKEFRRSRPLSSGRGLHFDGYFLLNEGWLDGAGGSTVIGLLTNHNKVKHKRRTFLAGHVRARSTRLGGL